MQARRSLLVLGFILAFPATCRMRGRRTRRPRRWSQSTPATAGRIAPDGRRERSVARHAGPRRGKRGCHRDRPDARLRHRVELFRAGDRLRGRRRTRADPHQPSRGHSRARSPPRPPSSTAKKCSSIRCTAIPFTTSASIATTRRNCASSSRAPCRCTRTARRSDERSASSATTPASSSRFSRARSPSSTATRPNTASASTTTSTLSICRPHPAPRVVPRVRRSSTSRVAWLR